MPERQEEGAPKPSGTELNERIGSLKEETRRKEAAMDMEMRRKAAEHRRVKESFDTEAREHLREAKSEDYMGWLRGHMEAGGKPTHYYDRDMSTRNFYVAMDDFTLPTMHGSMAVSVIVPKGIEVGNIGESDEPSSEEIGHNKLYFMDGYREEGGFVPVYADTVFKE